MVLVLLLNAGMSKSVLPNMDWTPCRTRHPTNDAVMNTVVFPLGVLVVVMGTVNGSF